MSYLVDVLSARFVPQVWRTELMNQLSTHVILDPIGCLDSATYETSQLRRAAVHSTIQNDSALAEVGLQGPSRRPRGGKVNPF
jgi:hypothetical protein